MDHKSMMQRAKAQLAGNWWMCAVAVLIYSLIEGAAGFTYVGSLLLAGPLSYGLLAYIKKINDTHESDFNTLFSGFSNFVNTMVAGLLISLAVGVGLCVFIIPGIILACGFAMAYFFMLDDPKMGGVEALQASWNMMKGHKWDFFCLNLRFIGWWIVCCLTCGLGFFFLLPYMYATYLNYYRQLRYGAY